MKGKAHCPRCGLPGGSEIDVCTKLVVRLRAQAAKRGDNDTECRGEIALISLGDLRRAILRDEERRRETST